MLDFNHMKSGNSLYEKIKKHLTFDGRETRTNYWLQVFISILLVLLTNLILLISDFQTNVFSLPFIRALYFLSLFIFLPLYLIFRISALTSRRLHDIGMSAIGIFIGLIPFGVFYLFYLLLKKGDSDRNRFGEPNLGKHFKNLSKDFWDIGK